MNRLIEFFAKKGAFVDLLTVAVVIVGISSVLLLKREVFPNVAFDVITITTIYPGSAPEEVEKLITNPIEQGLKEVDGIKKLTSVSVEGRSLIIVQLDPDETTESEGKSDIQDVIDLITDFPEDAEDPVLRAIQTKQTPVIQVSVSSDLPPMELREKAKQLKEVLEDVSGVARISIAGFEDVEIRVETDPNKLERFQLSLEDVINSIQLQNHSIPGGVIEAPITEPGAQEFIVRTAGDYKTVEDVKSTVIRANDLGRTVKVTDIATIKYDLKKSSILNSTDGKQSINLIVIKKERADAVTVVERIKAAVDGERPRLGEAVSVKYVDDFSYYIERRIRILSTNLALGLILVIIVLSLILPVRVALIVCIGIPFAFLVTLFMFYVGDSSINLITLIGLIIVVGMLVDDAVVVMDNAVRLIEEGMDPEEAAIKGTQQIWVPVTASVFTTIFAFAPMMFMSGILGKFISNFPTGVILGLFASLFECYFVLPHHISKWIRKESLQPSEQRKKKRLIGNFRQAWEEKVVPLYVRIVSVVLKKRYWVLLATVVGFIGTMVIAGATMKFVLFPRDGIEVFFIRAETPVGSGLQYTKAATLAIEDAVAKLPSEELKNFVTEVGITRQDPNDPNTKRGSHFTQVRVYLTPEETRTRKAKDIIKQLRDDLQLPKGFTKIRFDRVNPGPPVGAPISIGVQADEYEDILPALKELQAKVETIDGITDVDNGYDLGKSEIYVIPNPAETAAAGLNILRVGNAVRAAFEGIEASSIRTLDEELKVIVSYPESARTDRSSLEKITIRNPIDNLIPLKRIATFEERTGIATVSHYDNKREVKVTGDVDTKKLSPEQANNQIRKFIPELMEKHPKVSFRFGGEDEDTQESLQSLKQAFLVATLGIFLMLVLVFNSLMQSFLVLLTVPLGILGVIWAFFIQSLPLSFFALLGIIALAGVIVNNAIVFVDFVNQNRKKGADRFQSIIDAGKVRIRPIVLTTITTVAGVLPTAYPFPGFEKDPFVVPVVMSLGWGLLLGSFLTTLVFPAFIAIQDDIAALWDRVFKKT